MAHVGIRCSGQECRQFFFRRRFPGQSGIDEAARAVSELSSLGWWQQHDFIPFAPWRCAPRGAVPRKDGGAARVGGRVARGFRVNVEAAAVAAVAAVVAVGGAAAGAYDGAARGGGDGARSEGGGGPRACGAMAAAGRLFSARRRPTGAAPRTTRRPTAAGRR